ncbi:hypothetical protein TPSD3_15880 [Thioflexithrix psekupsensis]|uniref:histidine kinase n=1 Tax=Thioflexithrix psekupsensis TaxID=1570016 RepID=A0A251X5Z2_9GAMM|nr:hypothetical protein TPSD3_15880 [Thioflexithrix psekupsensis]
MLLIIPILIAMSVSDYLNAKNDLKNAYHILQKQTENNIINAIKLVDAGTKVLIRFLDKEMEEAFKPFRAAYMAAGNDPEKVDLEALRENMAKQMRFDLGDGMDLYIIDPQGIVRYTTYKKDLGLDFRQWPELYEGLQRALMGGGETFVSGGLSTEANTGILRTYAYMASPDSRYVLELGLKSSDFANLIGELDLIKISDRLKTLDPSLNQVRIFSRHGHVLGDTTAEIDDHTKGIIHQVYETRMPVEIISEERRRITNYIFVNLRDENLDLASDPSKVIELTYNTKLIDESLQRVASFHFVLSVIAMALSIIFTFFISAWITHPIQKLVDGVNIIANGNLEHPIEVKTNNELKLLKHSIAIMVDNMSAYIHQIRQQNLDLKELDKLKDDFLSNTSHELRTPINGIIGIADSMIDGAAGKLPSAAIENLSMIVLSGRRLSNLVNDILDFSKLKHKNIELQIKPIDIKIVIDVVVTLSQPLIGHKELKLINHIKDVPPVKADENRLQQILHNLIGNAIKFTEIGTVEIDAKIQGDFLLITIRDTGVGIPSERLDRVFTPFEQADGSISRQFSGTGLGLSITKQLVELHGGEIQIQSTLGIGTRVNFTLPLSKGVLVDRSSMTLLQRIKDTETQMQAPLVETTENHKEFSKETSGIHSTIESAFTHEQDVLLVDETEDMALLSRQSQRETFNVLIVDDDPINLQVLENQLKLENYAVTRASDGASALEEVRSGKSFAIILLDIMMPKMSGFEVCKIIRETHPATQLPIIMLTAKNQVSDLVEGLQSGANDYLTKPFSKGELITRIKTHVHLSRVNIAYSNFVPLEFLKLLEKESIIDVRLGDHVQKHMAILFADIRSFTTLSESMTPKENFDFINAYLGRVSPVIRDHHGFIDKYIGDAVMALFPEKADDAVQAAIEIHRQLDRFNTYRIERGLPLVKVGIGVHIGTLMLGTIGEEKRMEGTVISDAVNLASRLEGLTKLYGAAIIISGDIIAELEDPSLHYYRFLGKVLVKGKQEPVHIFEIVNADPEEVIAKKMELEQEFGHAIELYYEQRFRAAARQFQQIVAQSPQDRAAVFYLERCQYYLEHGTPSNWAGVEILLEK